MREREREKEREFNARNKQFYSHEVSVDSREKVTL